MGLSEVVAVDSARSLGVRPLTMSLSTSAGMSRFGRTQPFNCQRYGTTCLPRAWDHRGALLRMLAEVGWVKSGVVSLAV